MPIRKLKARQILDSRGEPTVEVDLITDIGLLRSSAPCMRTQQQQTTENEAKEIRDGDEAVYNGRGVLKVVESINNAIAPELLKSKLDVHQQREIDLLLQTLDGTPDRSKLGRNAILGVSVACCKASAAKRGMPLYKYIASLTGNETSTLCLPVPVFNLISGGRAAGNNLVYQEFLILPTGATSFAESLRMGVAIQRELECKLIELQELQRPLPTTDEGSFAPTLEDDKEALGVLDEAIKSAGFEGKAKIGVDVAASGFCRDGKYDVAYKSEESDPENDLEPSALREQYSELLTELPTLVSLEDPFGLEDWPSWSGFASEQPAIQIVADTLVAMNKDRLDEAVEKQAANAVVIRLSQIGTVTEALQIARVARENAWALVVSSGEGETEDTFVADFAVGVSAGQFKAGAPCRGEKVNKYNQLLRIEEELGAGARFAGENFRNAPPS